ncbi:DUF1343 domain-containing protein [Desulfobacter hydrogenophilus]|uniref:DUF1343 domain-containing protein n=1 Tax=Desulfobacter hydrogenophilus TaxID=2291 RepID=A0A328FGT5_9BACT|nr:DUF1343 domain-containing protein [Desulfobacter hydrogenophilus]NDY73473.1 DUF1343 domain-containing protein [Desulfobacter hydrogenophilus]QBH14401.1 DUF1343 domain-containing protein [Desulfobacter hydrogenophilus]RAM02273.1 DUF1343 domain-containing protein [Desulfobacter hydrogenophilus]
MDQNSPRVKTGLDTLYDNLPGCLKGRRLGLLANPASITSQFQHAKDVIAQLFPGQICALFSPQHGFFAEKQDNMIESGHFRDPELNIPVFSLYSETRIPTAAMFAAIDTLVIDIQDVGTRVYTFIYTISYCLETAAKLGKSVVILDRPNPVGGIQVEGNILEDDCASFVGRYPIPMRHGMTVGEMTAYINTTQKIGCDLTVIPMQGWTRDMYWQDTGLVWVPPSPNLPTPLSAMVYPGQVIFEGTNLSEGRGTTLPFEQFGAPFVNINTFKQGVQDRLKGIVLRPLCFQPTSGKWQNQICNGVQIHIIDRDEYKPYLCSLILLQEIMRTHPNGFQFKAPPYEYEFDRLPMDLILGSRNLRKNLEVMNDPLELEKAWQVPLQQFKQASETFYLYI